MGIEFLAIDLESFVHLQKIVEYHSCHEAVASELLKPAFPVSRPRAAFKGSKARK